MSCYARLICRSGIPLLDALRKKVELLFIFECFFINGGVARSSSVKEEEAGVVMVAMAAAARRGGGSRRWWCWRW